ncbi:MAG: NAD(+) diphosphatase [Gammaproteobacteria bacterium]|nr:NAD(+) diphosphatase [Gammaproteobacteria bacterium]
MYWRTEFPQFKPDIRRPDTLQQPHYYCFLGQQVVVGPAEGPWQPLTAAELAGIDGELQSEHYLGRLDGCDCLAVQFDAGSTLPDSYGLVGLRQLLGRVDEEHFYLAGRALQILDWDRGTRYCGGCGSPTRVREDDRSKFCDECRIPVYPRLSPSIIVLVTRGEQMLLARNAAWGPSGFYSTLAGFIEPGESVEEAVHREVFEEVGVKVRNLRYLGSQSWPFPNSLMLGFHAEYAGGEFQYHDNEIADAQWFHIDDLPKVPTRYAISRWLIEDYIEQVRSARTD